MHLQQPDFQKYQIVCVDVRVRQRRPRDEATTALGNQRRLHPQWLSRQNNLPLRHSLSQCQRQYKRYSEPVRRDSQVRPTLVGVHLPKG